LGDRMATDAKALLELLGSLPPISGPRACQLVCIENCLHRFRKSLTLTCPHKRYHSLC
jgi:hypothetical protein